MTTAQQVNIRLTEEMLQALRGHARANERTVTQTVRLAITQFLEREDQP